MCNKQLQFGSFHQNEHFQVGMDFGPAQVFKECCFGFDTSFDKYTAFQGWAVFERDTRFSKYTRFVDFVPTFRESTHLSPNTYIMSYEVLDFMALTLPGFDVLMVVKHPDGVFFGYRGEIAHTIDELECSAGELSPKVWRLLNQAKAYLGA